MKISVRGKLLESDSAVSDGFFSVEVVDESTCILSYTGFGGEVKSIDLSINDLGAYESMTIHYSPTHGFLPVKNSVNSRDTDAFYSYYYNCKEGISACFARGGSSDTALTLYGSTKAGNWVNESFDMPMSNTALLDKFLPGFASNFGRRRDAKVKLMSSISPLDSLSSLEKQVDLLTSLVVQLAALIPGSDALSLVSKIKGVVDQAGSNENKTDDEAVDSITTFKKSLRQAQEVYFTQRQAV